MTYNARFEKSLPMINISDKFLIQEDAYTKLGEDWLAYAKHTLDLAFKEDTSFKTIRDIAKTKGSLLSLNERAKNLLGMGEDFRVIDIDVDDDNNIKVRAVMGYDDLIGIYYGEKRKIHSMEVRAIVDRFFGYQWGRQKLLYPINIIPSGYQRPENWNEMVQQTELSQMLSVWFKQKVKSKKLAKQTLYQRRQALNRVLSSTRWYYPAQVTESELSLMRDGMLNAKEPEEGSPGRKSTTLKPDITILNDLRFMLIDQGRTDIKRPRDIAREKQSQYYGEGSSIEERFEWVDTEKFPTLAPLKEKAYSFLETMKHQGLSAGTINGKSTAVNNFFRFLIEMCPFEEITVDFIDAVFEPDSKVNLYKYLKEKRSNEASAIAELNKIIHFLVYCELYSAKAKKNSPILKTKPKRAPYREAMPREMVAHIVDILKNRPPNSTTKWERERADSSWWEYDVYPVYPIMMLFGYYVPVRGEQVRNLCRENSFVFDSHGRIERFVINTDKNVNRQYLHEIPCVWDDLQIFVPFLKWHKAYFRHLPKVKYHNDDNSPWEDIVPLMITPQVLRPMDKKTHLDYHKRVLCQYQIEVREKAQKEGRDDYPVVAWRKDGKPFFGSIDELNRASSTEMQKIAISYDIHSLRVTGATRYLEAGAGIKTVMDLTGHTSAETLIHIYVNLTREEKERSLRSAVDKVFFGDKEKIVENSKVLIKGEFVKAYSNGAEAVKNTIEENKLFSLYRKASVTKTSNELMPGTEIALEHHPSTWRPMIQGICPSVKCPEGRENKCSLCPYLITGKLFVNGIVHNLNNLFAAFQRTALIIENESKSGYDNHALMEEQETRLEEIIGYQEILERINNDIVDENAELSKEAAVTLRSGEKVTSAIVAQTLPTELAYLKNAYNAELMGVEKDHFGMKVLTIKAMKIAAKMGDYDALDSMGENESKAIDLLMQYYTSSVEHGEDIEKFISSIGILPQKIKKGA